MPAKRIAIVGSTGLVGARLVERLCERSDVEARAIIHSSGNAWRLSRLGIPLITVDLLDRSAVREALAECTHVVNCSRGSNEVMIHGLRNLLEESCRRNISGFVHLSSVAVYGDPPASEAVSEDAPTPRHPKGSYADTKSIQDRMVQRYAKSGLRSTILCPPNIAGPYSYFLLGLLQSIRAQQFALLGEGDTPCVLVDADNLCDAIVLALDKGSRSPRRVFITDDDAPTWRQVIEGLLPLLDSPPPVRSISRSMLEARARQPTSAMSSPIRTLKHLVSSTVRDALRQDPLLAQLDHALRRAVSLMGESVESRFRLAIEGPIRVAQTPQEGALNIGVCAQQLRGVKHSSSQARREIGYLPSRSFHTSMEDFRYWYRSSHQMDSEYWDLFKRLY